MTDLHVGGTHGVQQQTTVQQQDAPQQAQQGRSIGDKIASFFKAIGHAIAAPFKALANLIAGAGNHAVNNAHGAMTRGATFTQEEKQQLLDECYQGAFYQSVGQPDSTVSKSQFEGSARAILNDPGAVAAMKAHGVTLEEAVAISIYTSQAFKGINDQIRSGNETPEVTQLKTAFNSGLAKLPSFEGEVYRGARLPENVGLDYQVGNIIQENGIMSTTWDPDQKFTDRINYDIVILLKDGSSGKDISMFSDKPTENEVAFPTGVQFTVTGRARPDWVPGSDHLHPQEIMTGMYSDTCQIVMSEV